MAKSLFAAAVAEGVDPSDPDGLQQWLQGFNDRPEAERHRILPDTAFSPSPPSRSPMALPTLPPVALPDDAEVAASMAAAPILTTFAALATFVGAGRKLTKTGQFVLVDARILVELLETGDVVDGEIGDHQYKTKSSADLIGLRQIFSWARKAGIVRVANGRVIATKHGLAIGRDPAASFVRAVDAIMAIGPLASLRDPSWWLASPELDEFLDGLVPHLLTGPYVARRPVPVDELSALAAESALAAFEFRTDDDHVARRVARDVADIFGSSNWRAWSADRERGR